MYTRHVVPLAVLGVLILGAVSALHAAQPPSDRAAKPTAEVVNINTATAAQLEGLPGIGPKTAQAIVEYRQKNGSFKKIEELMNVKGIGEKAFLRLKNHVTVTPPKTDRTSGPRSL